ncbi:DNA integrity scanning protein DisA nucleotide-binding domain protein [Hippea jasoniae]|uniref:DNA integrity scanning protein DisA nucleotide-binding domain protein n=1 Tax=Hippea jasoniae TaxID=944479 RepID=UPI00068E4936|nr:diadenylate cyclase [Hippea jasoniae]
MITAQIREDLLKKAFEIAKNSPKSVVVAYYSDISQDKEILEFFEKEGDVGKVIVMKESEYEENEDDIETIETLGSLIKVPDISFDRINKIKVALMIGTSSGILSKDHDIVALTGSSGGIDTVMFLDISKEKELLSFKGDINLEKTVKPEVFEKVLRIALELANQGREGKSVGAIFILGDKEKVLENIKQMIFNPFKGYSPDERNILKVNLDDTLKEYSLLDGAIVIDCNGVIETAGAYISVSTAVDDLPKGLGARHIAAASITAVTNAISIVVSESTGDVTIFKNGSIITRIEKVS